MARGHSDDSVQDEPQAQLRQRREPQQARGRAAMERILNATGELLDELGFDGVTTLSIAERAGVNIATVYRYFPNKFAVMRSLAERLDGERAQASQIILGEAPADADWMVPIRQAVDEAARLRDSQPGGRALRRALQSSPELWHIDHEQTLRVTAVLASAFRERRPDLSQELTHDVSLVVVTTVTALLDLGNDPHTDEARIRKQLVELLERYLAPYLDQARTGASPRGDA